MSLSGWPRRTGLLGCGREFGDGPKSIVMGCVEVADLHVEGCGEAGEGAVEQGEVAERGAGRVITGWNGSQSEFGQRR